MKKIIIGLLVVIVLIVLTGLFLVNRWADTKYGKLDYKTAIALKFYKMFLDPGPLVEITPRELRQLFNKFAIDYRGTPAEVASVKDENIPGSSGQIPIRIYTPEGNEMLPILIFFHGGGWVVGNIDTHDNTARYLAKKSSSIVVSVDYRLAPENPFPAAMDDAYSALQWVSQNAESFGGDPGRIAVAGDSAGGNLAAVVSLMSRDRDGPKIKYQVLTYPAVDLSNMNTESYDHFAKGFFLTKEAMQWFRSLYLPDKKDWQNPYASPLLAEDHSNLPPAFIITAQFDPLRDEGEAYAKKLKQAGVPVRLIRYDGMTHGFVSNGRLLRQSHDALDNIAAELKKAL